MYQEGRVMLELLRKEANRTYTENDALSNVSTGSECLDLFAVIGALRFASEEDIIGPFSRAYAEDANIAVKILFFARDIRGGLGERRLFRVLLKWLSDNEPETCRKNLALIGEYGRYDDLLCLLGTACEQDMMDLIRIQLKRDQEAMSSGKPVSLLGKWLPSVNTSNAEAVRMAKKIARALAMTEAQYRKLLSKLRLQIRILENNLREKDYSFDYEKQPSRALFKYRRAFQRNDSRRYQAFLNAAETNPSVLHTGTLAPYDIIASAISDGNLRALTKEERRSMDISWNAQPDFTAGENALVVVDGSASMYWGETPLPAAVAQSLGIYFAERNKGAFKDHFITFSSTPKLVKVKGRDIAEKLRYCMQFNDCSNTDLEKVFDLILNTALKNHLPQAELPVKLYIISDMEFDCCSNAGMTNFQSAKKKFEEHGYLLPRLVFWNVQSRRRQQPVTRNEQGVCLISGCNARIFSMLKTDTLDPYHFMLQVLNSERYAPLAV